MSFLDYFGQDHCPIPPSFVTSSSVKAPTSDEILASGPAFHNIQRLDINKLSLPGHLDFTWAQSVLSTHGPIGHEQLWDQDTISTSISDTISSEGETLVYVENVFLRQAVCGAVCLFEKSSDLSPSSYPGRYRLKDKSSSGPSGRADRTLLVDGRICAQFEGKTLRASMSEGHVDVLQKIGGGWFEDVQSDQVSMDPSGSSIRPAGDINWYRQAWQKKAQKILFRVWHQLFSRSCNHGVILNEVNFVLAYREKHSLRVSECLPFEAEDVSQRQTNLASLSFFLAHALYTFLSDGNLDSTSSSSSSSESSLTRGGEVADDDDAPFFYHHQTDSSTTVRNVSMSNSTSYNTSIHLGTPLNISSTPFNIIFVTSGVPSTPVPLMPLDDSVPLDGTTLLVTEVCARNPASVVFRGYVGLESVIVKMAETEYIKYLRHEYSIYGTLSPLQGIIIPKCFGLFSLSPTCYIMILEDCGKPVSELSHLVDDQRRALFSHLCEIHRRCVQHNDISSRNILLSPSGKLVVADFDIATKEHCCEGSDSCGELQDLRDAVEI